MAGPGKAVELLLDLDRSRREPLRRQLEDELRRAIASGALPGGTHLPSSRSLAEQLGVSRGVVVEAYDQLTAQGLLISRPRRVPVVRSCDPGQPPRIRPAPRYRFLASPNAPDLSLFPRRAWSRATAEVMRSLPDDDLDYTRDARGPLPLREALVSHLARVRRVQAELESTVLTLGFLHGLDLLFRVLAQRGAKRIAVENPSTPEQLVAASRNGIAVEPIPVDEGGLVVEDLVASDAEAVIVTPAHQFPLGVVLSPERRRALAAWAREREGLIVENDYGAEFRYDGAPIGAMQALVPERTVYLGTTSKALAPAVRLGWLVAPPGIAEDLAELCETSGGFSGLGAFVVGRLIETGAYDRHVQRCRREYRRRRQALVASIAAQAPVLQPLGAAAGLHLTVRLPADREARTVAAAARSELIDIRPLSDYAHAPISQEPGLVLGYGRLPTSGVPAFVASLARAVEAG